MKYVWRLTPEGQLVWMLMDKTHHVMITLVVTVCKVRVCFDSLVALDWNKFHV